MLDIRELQKQMPKIGDKVIKKLTLYNIDPKEVKQRVGTVIYAHPTNLWYTAEFNVNGVVVRQAYHVFKSKGGLHSRKKLEDPDSELFFNGVSSSPKRRPKEMLHDSINDIITQMNDYNQFYHTNLTYGKYVQLLYNGGKKRRGKNSKLDKTKNAQTPA